MASKLRTASWVLLAIVGVLTLLLRLVSSYLAYAGNYPIGGVPVALGQGGAPLAFTLGGLILLGLLLDVGRLSRADDAATGR